ncbi:MAG: helix-turn-helix transcriptional regulator [Actinobacteria bacterium]|nr:helix-turn-helix transcriptional regulator [Actinomycetota bacterium]
MDTTDWGLTRGARERLGHNLTVRRLRAGMGRAELGSRAAVSTKRVASVEEGRAGATVDILVRLAASLPGITTLDELLAGVSWVPSEESRGVGGRYLVRRRGRS